MDMFMMEKEIIFKNKTHGMNIIYTSSKRLGFDLLTIDALETKAAIQIQSHFFTMTTVGTKFCDHHREVAIV